VNHEIGVIKDRLILLLLEDDRKKRGLMFDEMIDLLKKCIIPIRPNRSLPRELPRKVKFHMRTEVERANSILKDWLLPGKLYVKGHTKVSFVLFSAVVCLAALRTLQYFIL
jgi:hypothetical protein